MSATAQRHAPLALLTCLLSPAALADGNSVPINYDALSFLEEPLAVEVKGVTISGNALVDQSASYQHKQGKDRANTRAIGRVNVETQLPNSWRVGLQYVSNYNLRRDESYQDDLALFVADEWGTVAGGNVTGSVRELTRRRRGFGNAVLAYDDFRGALDQWGAFYSVRYNSYVASLTADAEGRAEAGLSFERPIGQGSYFLSARTRLGELEEANARLDGQTYGGAFAAGYTYASTRIDGQILYEYIDDFMASGEGEQHLLGSLGLFYQYGAALFSLEGALGEFADNTLHAGALGARFDVARGASFNLGVNYSNPNQTTQVETIGSLRYEF